MNQLPEAFLTRMRRQLGAEFEAYMAAMAQPPRRGGRVNGLKLSPEALFAIRPEFVPVGNEQFLLPEGTAPGKDPLHCAGAYYIQELSAQMPVSLLDVEPGMAVLDLCAAPGGKSAQLGQALQGQGLLVSNEIVPGRAQILCGNLERMGIENALITSMEPEALCSSTGPVFDRVLVDAPCAGEGMFRKDPQAAAEWSPEHVRSCARRQRSILMSAQKALKPGGMLVYSTCSFSPEENEETMEWFLSACPDFTLEQCRTLYPHNSLGEGQFAALLRRQGPLLPTLWRQEKSGPFAIARNCLWKKHFDTCMGRRCQQTSPAGAPLPMRGFPWALPRGPEGSLKTICPKDCGCSTASIARRRKFFGRFCVRPVNGL